MHNYLKQMGKADAKQVNINAKVVEWNEQGGCKTWVTNNAKVFERNGHVTIKLFLCSSKKAAHQNDHHAFWPLSKTIQLLNSEE
jgi:hypothetical protein